MAFFYFDPDRFIQRCWFIITTPDKEWVLVRKENREPLQIFFLFALPLIIFGSFTLWAGHFFAWNAFYEGLARIVTQSVFLWIFACGIYMIVPLLGAEKNFLASFKLATYSLAVIWIVEIPGNLSVFFAWIKIFSLYAAYVLWTGLRPVLKVPGNNRSPAFIVLLFVVLIIYSLLEYFSPSFWHW